MIITCSLMIGHLFDRRAVSKIYVCMYVCMYYQTCLNKKCIIVCIALLGPQPKRIVASIGV